MPNLTFYLSENHSDKFKTLTILSINAVPSARTQEVMENFIRELDFAIQQASGLTTHICPQLIPRY
ncbi:hypothetical protein FDK33_10125 [Citrobacter werkmanii]|nr:MULTISPECIES: hypothetical protein [Citrobacter]TKU26995.1 hypothetical protein FDX09_20310 [Citrobacter sp. wls717]TKU83150.1 hypothetical protein FDX13_12725 [Citrobacter sp. wls707]MBQ4923283.1 hypothetical protein [Citrobacter werkmanii]MBQ4934374.1 hypothetical protein [Citrobacter werkmanii]MBQ4948921.1 hypothetical protein [Citrobacter werkmanii]